MRAIFISAVLFLQTKGYKIKFLFNESMFFRQILLRVQKLQVN